ncbi:MAG: 3-hydroxyacyl-CoA dehydrogenase family protein [Desulfobacteria bacterium]
MSAATKVALVAVPGAPAEFSKLIRTAGVSTWDPVRVEKTGCLEPGSGIVFLMADTAAGDQQHWLQALGHGNASKETVVALYAPTLSVSELAMSYPWPEQVVGFGFLEQMLSPGSLIEIAPGLRTRPESVDAVEGFLKSHGFETERVGDFSCLVLRRVLFMIINEAAYALWEGIASREDIDLAMKQGTNYPMGPLEWADTIGLDRVYNGLKGLHEEYGDDRYRPCPLIRKLVSAGYTGKRAGRGFYSFNNGEGVNR